MTNASSANRDLMMDILDKVFSLMCLAPTTHYAENKKGEKQKGEREKVKGTEFSYYCSH